MKIITVIGARPQFIKAAVISRLFLKDKDTQEIIVHTGQHYDENMSHVFFEEMDIPKPSYNLDVNGLTHGVMTGQMLAKIESILMSEKPDIVLVYGDTNSTLAGALAAKKIHIPVVHIEAGLRSFNMQMPEEINRILTDRISDILFCPTEEAVLNLEKEGYSNRSVKIVLSGDVMQDAAIFYSQKAQKPNVELPNTFSLCTLHRAENTDDPTILSNIFRALEDLSKNDNPVVFPLHPRTKVKLKELNYSFSNSSIHFMDPVGYLEMIWLLKNCTYVLTDSGGLQKEAYFFRKKCVTLRNETEWVELVTHGFNYLAGTEHNKILTTCSLMKEKEPDFSVNLYGNGKAGEIIVKAIKLFKKI
ncbi:MAG: UDP-N-acetylglucosamine 2-epimerase (non-hydrolyzing) [Bacteroidales bacterium]|nr:UDP-N-acetylglucosamine 2-epimerase (non-hydrolyzing) [Bacteroidales bacterium]